MGLLVTALSRVLAFLASSSLILKSNLSGGIIRILAVVAIPVLPLYMLLAFAAQAAYVVLATDRTDFYMHENTSDNSYNYVTGINAGKRLVAAQSYHNVDPLYALIIDFYEHGLICHD